MGFGQELVRLNRGVPGLVATAATILSFTIGSSLSFLATVRGGWVDQALPPWVSLMMPIPSLISALGVLSVVPVTLQGLILVMRLLDATRVFRLSRAVAMIGKLGLPDPGSIGTRNPDQVSGGQLQRVMTAMAPC